MLSDEQLQKQIEKYLDRIYKNRKYNEMTTKKSLATEAAQFLADQEAVAKARRSAAAKKAAETRARQRAVASPFTAATTWTGNTAGPVTGWYPAAPTPTPAPIEEKAFWIVWNAKSKQPPVNTYTKESVALRVAEDMCRKHGEVFHVMKAVAAVQPPPPAPQVVTKRFS